MDNEKNNLAGSLSRPNTLPNNTTYIGTQSRFKKQETKKKKKLEEKKYCDIVIKKVF